MNDKLTLEAKNFLSLATSDDDLSPSAADRTRVRKGVGLALAATSGAGIAASAGSASAAAGSAGVAALTSGGLGLKAVMVIALVSGVAGVGMLTIANPETTRSEDPVLASTSAQHVSSEATLPSVPTPRQAEATDEGPLATPPAETPEVLSESPSTRRGADSQGPEPSAAAPPSRHQVTASAPPTEESVSAMSLGDELGLLRAAQRARVRGDFDEALHQLDQHDHRFPAGLLSAERDGTRVFVLCDAARSAEARAARRAFLRDHSSSPLARRVRDGCD